MSQYEPQIYRDIEKCYVTVTEQLSSYQQKLPKSCLEQIWIFDDRLSVFSCSSGTDILCSKNSYPVYPSMPYRDFQEKHSRVPTFDSRYNTEYIQVSPNSFEDNYRQHTKLLLDSVKRQPAIYNWLNFLKTTIQFRNYRLACSYRRLDWKTVAARLLQPLLRNTRAFLASSKRLQSWGHQSEPPSLGQHNSLIVELKKTLERNNRSGRCTSLTILFSKTLCTITCPGDLRSRHGLWQILYLSDFDEIGGTHTMVATRLSNTRRLTLNNLSDMSQASLRRTNTTPYALLRSRTTGSCPTGSTQFQGSHIESSQTVPATFTTANSTLKLSSVKKSRWVIKECRT